MANPWYAFYPGDYARDTAHLSMVEDSAYRRLLDHYYSTGRPIPTHVEQVFRICRAFVHEEQEAVRSVLREFFTQQPDGWHNPRVDREIQKASELTEKRRRAGRLSGEKRANARPTCEQTPVEQVFAQPHPQLQPQALSPSALRDFSFFEHESLSTSNMRASGYTPRDHLEKDIRKLREIEPEIEAIVAAQPNLDADTIEGLRADRSGLTRARIEECKEFQHRRPVMAERASA